MNYLKVALPEMPLGLVGIINEYAPPTIEPRAIAQLKEPILNAFPQFKNDVEKSLSGNPKALKSLINKVMKALESAILANFSEDLVVVCSFAATLKKLDQPKKAEKYRALLLAQLDTML